MTPSRSPPLIALTLGGSGPQILGVTPSLGPRAGSAMAGSAAGPERAAGSRCCGWRCFAHLLFLLLLLPPGAGEAPRHRSRPPAGWAAGDAGAAFPWDGWQLLETLGTAGERLPLAPSVLEQGGPAVTFAPGGPGPATAPPAPASIPVLPKTAPRKKKCCFNPLSPWREMEPLCRSRAGSSRGRSFHGATTPGSARLDPPGSALWCPPSQP